MRKIHLNRIIAITVAWTLLGVFLTMYDFLLLKSHLSAGESAIYQFKEALIFNVFAGFSGGFMGALTLIYVNRKYSSKPYYAGLIIVVLAFVFIVSFITIVSALIPALLKFPNPLNNPDTKSYFLEQILTTMHVKNIIFWAIVVAITHFSIQMSDKFGPGNLTKILTGKYNTPKHEHRIFMFIDLKASTTIAEQLGGERYHQFLKDIFAEITLPIINNQAEIYQYVGDEVVVSWSKDIILHKEVLLNCFFDIQKQLSKKADWYTSKFDAIPEFKAGAHLGEVVAGEVGIIKRDITYSGDVLNTSARIQAQCNALESNFLISDALRDFIGSNSAKWSCESKGEIYLKGKNETLELYSVTEI